MNDEFSLLNDEFSLLNDDSMRFPDEFTVFPAEFTRFPDEFTRFPDEFTEFPDESARSAVPLGLPVLTADKNNPYLLADNDHFPAGNNFAGLAVDGFNIYNIWPRRQRVPAFIFPVPFEFTGRRRIICI